MDTIPTRCVPRNFAAEKYQEILHKRSPEELSTLAQIKRLLERHDADPRFREALAQSADAPQRVAESYGIRIDMGQAPPLLEAGSNQIRLPEEARRWPLARLWDDYLADLHECWLLLRRAGECAGVNPRFDAWRQRQARRCNSELGPVSAASITHPILAFELSAGCSIGCWFCGVSAGRLQGNFRYTGENAQLWRSILEQAVELFGSAAQAGFCFWATDPSDNPDYPKFIEDYYWVTGSLPHTTTAAPLRDPDFTRAVLRLAHRYHCTNTRFSILTLKIFDAVHAAFTAPELLCVGLVLQNRESLRPVKAVAGRAKERFEKLGDKPARTAAFRVDQVTIACVSGFLINMVNRTIQLTTPTRACERWPLGYRVYGERRFETAKDFRAALEDLMAVHMQKEIASGDVLSFRDDLCYRRSPEGFELGNAHGQSALGGFAGAGDLGDLIHEGNRTAGEIQAALMRAGADVWVVADTLQKLFQAGLLNEDPKGGGIGSKAPVMATVA
jgi:radical SAM family RiPP maturation amino acid epimerase